MNLVHRIFSFVSFTNYSLDLLMLVECPGNALVLNKVEREKEPYPVIL